ncbi:hypothetical protein GQ44DRAFT_731611 [Phaeosphaeriaceae sp. PMI808]|nr:hypothetical protein GQ44DRAFT_731611 [Phaeosphaeriaceae sp. PMI808]
MSIETTVYTVIPNVHDPILADRRRLKCPYFAQGWYFAINVLLWLSCIILAGAALKQDALKKETLEERKEQLSLVSFQMLWMQAAVLNIYHLRLVLFGRASKPWLGCIGLGFAASIQLAGAVVDVLTRRLGRIPCYLPVIVFLDMLCWENERFLSLHLQQQASSLAFYHTTFCGGNHKSPFYLQWLLCTIPVVTSSYKNSSHRRSNFDAMHTRMSSTQISEGNNRMSESTPASTIASNEDDQGNLSSKHHVEN